MSSFATDPVPEERPPRGPVSADLAPDRQRVLARLARAIAPRTLTDVGFEIPWRQRISTKIFGMIGVAALVTVAAFAIAEFALQRHLYRQIMEESDLLTATIGNSLKRTMLDDHRDKAYAVMEDIGHHPGIERVRMLDESGRMTYSTSREEIGRVVDRSAEGCAGCHREGAPFTRVSAADRSRVYRSDGHRVMAVMTPIYNEESCATASCHAHPPERRVLGVLDVGISLARLDGETRDFRVRTIGAAAVAVAVLGLVFWFFVRAHFVAPVAALVQGTRRVARDQFDLEIPVTWNGELGLLAASFNEMTRTLRKAHADLHHLMENLEHQVQERTEALRAAQDQLVRTEKLSSLGKLSASIAHEINNPLAGILTFAKLIHRTLDQGAPDDQVRRTMMKNLTLVERETERCSAIVRNLLDFARERPMTLKEVSVNAVADEAIQLLGNQIAIQGVKLEKRLGEVPMVIGDFGQLRQAFVNVIMNACEAMGRGGHLAVQTGVLDGNRVEVAFQDTGPGITPENLRKIFDPFFTTKEKGTGLGLSVVYGIVERHGGKIDIDSQVGKGTRVAIRLPAKKADGRPA